MQHVHIHLHVLFRQRALKALDERLKKSNEPINWPSLDEAGSSSQDDEAPTNPPQPDAVVIEKIPSQTKIDPPPSSLTHEQSKGDSTQ